MAYEPSRPVYSIPLGGKEYEVEGTFECIETVERAFKESFSVLMIQVVDGFPISDMAKLLHAILSSNGQKLTREEVGRELLNLGVVSPAYTALALHVYGFMKLCLSPPSDREQVRKDVGEMIGKALKPSPGETSSNTASASSAGRRVNSGKRLSGTR